MSRHCCVLATLLTLIRLAGFEPHCAATADDSVPPISLVGAQAAVCLEVPQFGATWSRFQRSQLLTRLKQFPPIERLVAGAGFQKWTQVEDHVRQLTGKSLSEHLVRVFSESVIVAVYLPEGAAPQGVVIAKAHDPAALKQALQAWALLEPQQVSRTLEHRGHPYVRRAKSAKSSEVVFYTIFDRTIALSDQEHLIQQVIEYHADADAQAQVRDNPRVLSELALYRRNRSRLPEDDVAAFLFLNVQKWEKAVVDAIDQSPDARWIRPAFRQVAALAASLRLNEELVVDLVTDLTGRPLPSEWQQFVNGTGGGGNWAQRIPADAILAVSSRMEIGPLVKTWLSLADGAKTEEFARGRHVFKSLLRGRDLLTEILPLALRDWTVHVALADGNVANGAPLSLLGRFSLQEGAGNGAPPVDKCVDQAMQFGMTFLAASLSHQRGANGQEPVIVESAQSAEGQVRMLKGLRNWSPGYLLSSGQLAVSTSAQGLLASDDSPRDPLVVQSSRLAVNSRRYFGSATQLVWIDGVRLRGALAEQGDWIAGRFAPDSTDARQRVRKHLANSEELTRIFDAAFLAASFDADHVRIVLGASLDRSE